MAAIRLGLEQMDEASRIMRAAYDSALPWLAGRHTPEEDRWFFREVLYGSCAMFGVRLAGELAGVMAVRPGWIEQLYVLPPCQGRGAGSVLLGQAWAFGPPLELWTFARNALARPFYERHGFRAVEETDGSRNEEREPDVRYRWDGGR